MSETVTQKSAATLPLFGAIPQKPGQPADSDARAHALDPKESFIVQAPAGSGKTELLTRRILALLATVDAPEEVLAITFTRKAASEMRTRVMSALSECEGQVGDGKAEAKGEEERFVLARAALARSRELGWELEKNPSRLWISTIDAFNHYLAGKMPWLSRLGGPPRVSTDALELYGEAAKRTFLHMGQEDVYAEAVEKVLAHLGNNANSFKWLVAALLAKRDQWLRRRRRIADPEGLRPELEAALAELAEAALAEAAQRLAGYSHLLQGLAAYAGKNSADDSPIALLREVAVTPALGADELDSWRGFAELFLTAKGEVRKSVNVRQGFPAGKGEAADWKARMKEALDALREDGEGSYAMKALAKIKLLPQPFYGEEQWEIIAPIIRVLDLAVGYLWGVMSERRECDFNEVAERGLTALGAAQDPSELLLALDRRLRHILVDEFQDTSHLQFQLLERLSEGWEPGDGRTLFLVGDPMQSIYRFRESEVALFFKAAREGVGPVGLTPLSLTVNFRSDGAVIDWLNGVFAEVFPDSDDAATGAVRYSPCTAFRGGVLGGEEKEKDDSSGDGPVRFVPLAGKEPLREAREVVEEAIARSAEGSVGILVRSRTHLMPIVSELSRRGVSYRGEELDKLKERSVVKDLRSLLDALFDPSDRLAWLSVLRAPWCGLTLAELFILVGDDKRPVMDIVEEAIGAAETDGTYGTGGADRTASGQGGENKSERLSRLSATAVAALERVWPILKGARSKAGRLALRELLEGVWCALGGPTYLDEQGLSDAEALFAVVQELDEAGQPGAPQRLDRAIEGLYARPDPGGDQGLSVMTIHKAKGLEFDTVLLPGLGHRPPSDKGQLIQWAELPSGGLVIGAPPPTMVGGESPVRDFIRELDKEKTVNERIRLLYVAATRARSRLVMWGAAKVEADRDGEGAGEAKPAAGSMLALLWFRVEGAFAGLAQSEEELQTTNVEPLSVERLPLGWTLPPVVSPEVGLRDAEVIQDAENAEDERRQFDWAREERKLIGTLAHRLIERISMEWTGEWTWELISEGAGVWTPSRVESMSGAFAEKLSAMGVGEEKLAGAVADVVAVGRAVLEDEKGRWIVGPHEDAHSEYELGGVLDGKVERRTIDRTFIDEHGVRWIVDYKVSSHSGDVEAFLEAEKQGYRPQLERYERMFRLKEPQREIRAALYYPLFRRFVEVVR